MEPPKTLTSRKTQTQVLQDILSLYHAGALRLFGAKDIDRSIFENDLTEAISIGTPYLMAITLQWRDQTSANLAKEQLNRWLAGLSAADTAAIIDALHHDDPMTPEFGHAAETLRPVYDECRRIQDRVFAACNLSRGDETLSVTLWHPSTEPSPPASIYA